MRGMTGEKLRRLGAPSVFHPFPKPDALLRIVARARHVDQTDVIGFRFVLAPERHENTELRAGAKRPHYRALFVVVHVGQRNGDSGERGLSEILLQDALRAMTRSGMRHLVTEHSGERSFVLSDGQDAGIDDNLPPGRQKAFTWSSRMSDSCQSNRLPAGPVARASRVETRLTISNSGPESML
jgi:hypothetical protein